MKDYLFKQFEQTMPVTTIKVVKSGIEHKSLKEGIKSILPLSKRFFTWTLFLVLALLFKFSSISAQTVENLENYLLNANATEVQQLDVLVDGDISTLFVYDQTFDIDGESVPTIADVALGSLPELYTARPEFASIQLLRIKVRNSIDLNCKLDFDKLKNFQNLRYVYVMVAMEVCPENEGDIACQKSKISNMFSGSEGNTPPTILFEVVNVM